MASELTIAPVPGAPVPTIVFGFSSSDFSQCVYLQVDEDPLKCVEMANNIHEAFIAACGAAVKEHKEAANVDNG